MSSCFSPIIPSSPQGLCVPLHHQYVGEISPKKLRGFANSTASFFWSLGKAAGQIAGQRYSTTDLPPNSYLDLLYLLLPPLLLHPLLSLLKKPMQWTFILHVCLIPSRELLGSQSLWPVLMASCGIPALVQLLTLPFFPESPPYLFMHKGDQEGCKKGNWGLQVPVPHLAFNWFVMFAFPMAKKVSPCSFLRWLCEYPPSIFLLWFPLRTWNYIFLPFCITKPFIFSWHPLSSLMINDK